MIVWRKYLFHFKRFDWILFLTTVVLVCFGLAAVYSVALSQEDTDFFNFKKQIVFAAVGIILLIVVSFVDVKMWATYSRIFYLGAIILLLALFIFGKTVHGTTGWFSFWVFSFQPVEMAKLVLIIFLARYFTAQGRLIKGLKTVFKSGLAAGILMILVLWQPDFGSALILGAIWLGMLILAGVKRWYFLLLFLMLFALVLSAWMFVFADYQKARVMTFLNPQLDPLGEGYNITQVKIAIGSGQFFGRGLSLGSQSQLKFLPEAQTDFIFAAIAEELGFLGSFLILGFWFILLQRIFRALKLAHDNFSIFLLSGILILFLAQIFINVGMNLGLLPIIGISLPLVSYGGSFLIISLVLVGMVESVVVQARK